MIVALARRDLGKEMALFVEEVLELQEEGVDGAPGVGCEGFGGAGCVGGAAG